MIECIYVRMLVSPQLLLKFLQDVKKMKEDVLNSKGNPAMNLNSLLNSSAAGPSPFGLPNSAPKNMMTSTVLVENQLNNLRGLTFYAIGLLSSSVADKVNTNLKIFELFVKALEEETDDPNVMQNVVEGIQLLRHIYVSASSSVRDELMRRLRTLTAVTHDKRTRLAALHYLNRIYSFEEALPRYVCC
jgi:hypothetical protein